VGQTIGIGKAGDVCKQVTIGIKNRAENGFPGARKVIIEAITILYGRTGFSTGVQENRYGDLGLL